MKMGDENTILNRWSKWFQSQKKGIKAGMVSTAALVVCGAVALVVAVNVKDSGGKVETTPSSEIVDTVSSGQAVSSAPQSVGETPSSDETVSEPASSETPASSDTASSQKLTAAAASSTPTVSTVAAGAVTTPREEAGEETSSSAVSSEPVKETPTVSVDFSQIRAANPDVKAQIYLPGTKLNYWVCQGTDNVFYLTHNAYKQKNGWAVPMMDFRATLTADARSTNIVLYGHSNDKTGEHFSAIKGYKGDQNGIAYYKQHPTIQFNTMYGDGNYKIIGMFLENVNVKGKSFAYHNFINAQTAEEFDKFVNEVKGRSFLTMPVDTQFGDELITLSTCLSTTTVNSRYVLVARKVRPGESATVDVDKVAINTNMIPASGPLN